MTPTRSDLHNGTLWRLLHQSIGVTPVLLLQPNTPTTNKSVVTFSDHEVTVHKTQIQSGIHLWLWFLAPPKNTNQRHILGRKNAGGTANVWLHPRLISWRHNAGVWSPSRRRRKDNPTSRDFTSGNRLVSTTEGTAAQPIREGLWLSQVPSRTLKFKIIIHSRCHPFKLHTSKRLSVWSKPKHKINTFKWKKIDCCSKKKKKAETKKQA